MKKEFPELVDTDSKGFEAVSYPALVSPIIEGHRELYHGLLSVRDRVEAAEAENAQLKVERDRLRVADHAKTRDIATIKAAQSKAKENAELKDARSPRHREEAGPSELTGRPRPL